MQKHQTTKYLSSNNGARKTGRSVPVPIIWLMTDERLGDRLLTSVKALPAGSAVVFRHYSLDDAARYKLFMQVRHIAKIRGILLFLAGDESLARKWGADGFHQRANNARHIMKQNNQWRQCHNQSLTAKRPLLHSVPVHNIGEIAQANQSHADYYLLSPIFPTVSHKGAKALGAYRFKELGQQCDGHVIALGGMNRARAQMLGNHISGWAAISALKK